MMIVLDRYFESNSDVWHGFCISQLLVIALNLIQTSWTHVRHQIAVSFLTLPRDLEPRLSEPHGQSSHFNGLGAGLPVTNDHRLQRATSTPAYVNLGPEQKQLCLRRHVERLPAAIGADLADS